MNTDDTFMLFSSYGINARDLQNGVNRETGYSAVSST